MSSREDAEELSAPEFAEIAADHAAVIHEDYLTLIEESDLPTDWLKTTIQCYSTEAAYYALAEYEHIDQLKLTINRLAAEEITAADCSNILDVGVGDGHRLSEISSLVESMSGRYPEMYGIELSERMIDRARARGVKVIKEDMRTGIPDFGVPYGSILFLSGGFGYLMDNAEGESLRLRILNSAYDTLAAAGNVVMELVSCEPDASAENRDVYYFSRTPQIEIIEKGSLKKIRGPTTWQYIKTFTMKEMSSIISKSSFDLRKTSMMYIVRSSEDIERIGGLIDPGEISADESYRLFAILRK